MDEVFESEFVVVRLDREIEQEYSPLTGGKTIYTMSKKIQAKMVSPGVGWVDLCVDPGEFYDKLGLGKKFRVRFIEVEE